MSESNPGELMRRIGQWRLFWSVCVVVLAVGVDAAADDGDEETALEVRQFDTPPEVVETADDHSALQGAIEAILQRGDLPHTDIGIHVRDLTSGEVLYSNNADQPMNPASNVKLVTAAAVLEHLGPSHTFETRLETQRRDGGRIADLYVRGEGEAFLLYEDVLGWASRLRRAGVEAIDGDVVIDDGAFDEGYLPPGFDLRDSSAAYRSPIGAVSVNFNAVAAHVKPGDSVGSSAEVRLDPPNRYVDVVNRAATTRGSGARVHVSSESADGKTTLFVSGSIGIGADAVVRRQRIGHPPAFAGGVVAEAMEMVGIEFTGAIRRGTTPDDAVELVTHESKPVGYAVTAMNKWSNNFIAEQLLRVLGRVDGEPSTWDVARNRVVRTLEEYGLAGGEFQLHNGSGLYDGNELSARHLVHLLGVMDAHPYGPEFRSSLTIAGVDGTLRHRLDDGVTAGNLRGKTGTLRDVSALSGYVTTVGGRQVAFSILFNDPPRRAWNYRSEQDAIARVIAEYDG